MAQHPELPRRRSIRIHGRDYGQRAWNYVTICAQGKACLFGRVVRGVMRLNGAGRMVLREWRGMAGRFPGVSPEDVVVMPNHLHWVLHFHDPESSVPLGRVVGAFKSATTVLYTRGVRDSRWPRFEGRLWQRGYWERVLRDHEEYVHARFYIESNPAFWERDRLHPELPLRAGDHSRGEWWEVEGAGGDS